MPKLTKEQLAEIRRRAENVTSEPWELDGKSFKIADAIFIGHARTDIPALLEHIEELEAELARLKQPGVHTICPHCGAVDDYSVSGESYDYGGSYSITCGKCLEPIEAGEEY